MSDQPEGRTGRPAGRKLLLAALVASALVLLVVVALALTGVLGRGDEARGAPREVSVGELRDLAAGGEQPVYWAGAIPGRRLELTATDEGNVFVRYLSGDAAPGDPRPAFTTVGTYPFEGAIREVERRGRADGMESRPVPGGGLATWSERRPTSVYVAYPGSDVLVEVFDPDGRRARELVLSGEVGPIR
jgi:hypothetical protein